MMLSCLSSENMMRRKKVAITGGNAAQPGDMTLIWKDGNKRVFRTGLSGGKLLQALGAIAPDDFTVEDESMEEYFWDLYGLEDAQ